MIVILKPKTAQEEVEKLSKSIERLGVEVHPVIGKDLIILGLIGDTTKIDARKIEANKSVERVMHVQEPFKKANRLFHPQNSEVKITDDISIGGKKIALIAGPCSVESEDQIIGIAKMLKNQEQDY